MAELTEDHRGVGGVATAPGGHPPGADLVILPGEVVHGDHHVQGGYAHGENSCHRNRLQGLQARTDRAAPPMLPWARARPWEMSHRWATTAPRQAGAPWAPGRRGLLLL